MTKYKGIYRLRTEIDKKTNTFPREYNGEFATNDVYIDCHKNIRIHHYGKSILEAYIPSLQTGRAILKFIYRDLINKNNTNTKFSNYDVTRKGETVSVTKETIEILDEELYIKEINNSTLIFHIEETDEEVLFRFHSKNMDKLEKYLKPKTNGADRSPFSTKNLPKSKYIIPDEDLVGYKKVIEKIPKNQLITIVHRTNNFLQSLVTKKNTWENIKSDMALKGLKGKEYIHSIGKWEEYIECLRKEFEK